MTDKEKVLKHFINAEIMVIGNMFSVLVDGNEIGRGITESDAWRESLLNIMKSIF